MHLNNYRQKVLYYMQSKYNAFQRPKDKFENQEFVTTKPLLHVIILEFDVISK